MSNRKYLGEGVRVGGVVSGMLKSSATRLVGLPVTALAGAVTTFAVINYAGPTTYGYIALVGMLFQLVPFADLGLGASIVNAVAGRGAGKVGEELAVNTVRAASRALALSAVGVLMVSSILAGFNLWGPVLGIPAEIASFANWAVLIALFPFAISLPLGIGQRILLGTHKNHVVNLVSAIGPVCAMLATLGLMALQVDPIFLAVGTPFGVMIVALICFFVALRSAGWSIGDIREKPTSRVHLWNTAAPMLIVSITVPLAMQSGRLMLSHFGTSADLAEFSIAFQFYTPALSLVTTAAVTLWPVFARDRSKAKKLWFRVLIILSGCGLVFGLGFGLLIGPVAEIVSSGEVPVEAATAVSFGVLLFVMSAHQAAAVLLTTPRLLAFQAVCCVAMLVLATGGSIIGASFFGAFGVVSAMAIAVAVAQLVPGILRSIVFFRSAERSSGE